MYAVYMEHTTDSFFGVCAVLARKQNHFLTYRLRTLVKRSLTSYCHVSGMQSLKRWGCLSMPYCISFEYTSPSNSKYWDRQIEAALPMYELGCSKVCGRLVFPLFVIGCAPSFFCFLIVASISHNALPLQLHPIPRMMIFPLSHHM